MTSRRPGRRAITRIAAGAGAALAVTLLLAALAPVVIRGPRLGTVVGWMLPPMRGSIAVAGGRWSWGAVWALMRGRPATLSLDGVRVLDPEGTEVLRAAHITVAVELARDHTRLVLHDLRVSNGAWRFATMRGARDVGFLAALQPARKGPARVRAAGGGLTSFAIVGGALDDLDTTFDFPAWGLSLAHVRARGNLAIGPEAASPAGATPARRSVFTFDVTDAELRGGGVLRLLGGRARVELPFTAGQITRVATTATDPDALRIEATGVATGRSRLTLAGSFTGIYGVSRPRQPAGIDLHARLDEAADAVRAVLARRAPAPPIAVAGDSASLQLGFSGPFNRLAIAAAAHGFDARAAGLDFPGLGFDLTIEPAAGRARVRALTFRSPAGGRLTFDGDVDRLLVHGALALESFSTTPYLPAFLRPLAGGVVDGRLRGALDLIGRSAVLDEVGLTLARPPGGAGPRRLRVTSAGGGARGDGRSRARAGATVGISGARFQGGTLTLPAVSGALAGGQITARVRVALMDDAGRLRPPTFDVDARARRISFAQLAGAGFVNGLLSFRARARGTLDDLAVALDVPPGQTLRVFGEACRLPASTRLHVSGDGVALPDFRLHGEDGAEIALAGRISHAGELALTLDVRGFPLGKLPALAEAQLPFSGTLSGRLRAAGPLGAPELTGEMAIDGAAFRGRPLGGGRLAVTPRAGGALHATGQVVQGVTVEGTLAPGDRGVRGLATMRLDAVSLDPFLSMLPGGTQPTGRVSGTLEARVTPGEPASLEARLGELALGLTLPLRGARGGPARPGVPPTPPPAQRLELHAVSEVRLSARASGGPIRLEPARFAGATGSVELWGERANGRTQAGARGRLALAALAPLMRPWVSQLDGALDFDVAATAGTTGAGTPRGAADARATPARAAAPLLVSGNLRVAAPIVFRIEGLPFDARIAAGDVHLGDDGVARVDLPLTLGAGTLRLTGTVAAPPLTWLGSGPRLALDVAGVLDGHLLALAAPRAILAASGGAHLAAHIEGSPPRPSLRARLRPDDLTLTLRAQPALPIAIAGGQIDLDDGAVAVRGLRVVAGRAPAFGGEAIIGATGDGAAVVQIGSPWSPRPARTTFPVRGRITAVPVSPAIIDDAGFALRLDGDLARRARLTGEITVVKAHVPRARQPPARAAPLFGSKSPPAKSTWASWRGWIDPARIDLDVAARSHGGAVTVAVPHLPDVRVDVDYHVTGTAAKPQPQGRFDGANIYSSVALFLRRLFQ